MNLDFFVLQLLYVCLEVRFSWLVSVLNLQYFGNGVCADYTMIRICKSLVFLLVLLSIFWPFFLSK